MGMRISQYESQLAAYNAYYSGGGGSVGADAFAGAAGGRPEALARFAGAAAGVGEQALEAYATAQQQRTPVDLVEEGNALEADYAKFYADYIANNTGEQAKDAAQHSASFLHQRLNAWYERWQDNPYAQQYIAQHGGRLSARAHAAAQQFAQQEQQAYTQQVYNSKFALAESALGDVSLTEEDFAAIRTDLGNTAKALFPEQDTNTLHTAIERRVIGTRLQANLAQNRFEAARQALAGQEALLGEQMPVYEGAIRRAEALALARQEEADKQATQAAQQAAVERAYQALYGPQIAQDMEEAEALLAGEEARARFGLDEQGAQQTLGLLRAQAAQNRATQATIRQQEEQQLLNTVLDLAQGTQGQAADPVAACKAVQASGLDPESKAQVLLALEQGRINTRDEPQSVNALAEAIIRSEERGTDTEIALTRAMVVGQLTHKSRERLLQLNEQIHGPYGSMLQHAYAGLAAQFGQNGSAAAQQLAQQHLQAGFNSALKNNNFQELERLSCPDTLAAIASRYSQSAQTQTDYLEGFNPLEGPHLSAAQGGSRSDAGGYADPEPEEQQNYDGMVQIEGSGAANTAELPLAAVHGGIKGLNAFLELLQAFPDDREPTATDYTKLFEGLYIEDGMPLQRLDPLRIPNIPAPESAAGAMLAAATQFLLGFKGAEKVLAGMAAGTKGLSIGKSLGKAALSDFAFFDGQEERLSNLVQSVPALANPVNAFLAAAPDDRQAEGRLKNALEGLGMGIIAEGMVHGLGLTKFGRQRTQGELQRAEQKRIRQKQERAAIKKEGGNTPPDDYTDHRSPDTMSFADKDLQSIKPDEADRLYVGSGNKREYYSERDAKSLTKKYKQDHNVAAKAIETAPGQWKVRVDSVSPIKMEKELHDVVKQLQEALQKGVVQKIELGVVGLEEAVRVKAKTGQDILLHKRSLSSEDMQHAIERHNQQAAALGEKPISYKDIAKYGEVVTQPSNIYTGTRPNSIVYEKRYTDGTLCLVEQVVKGNNIEFRSMWKNKVAEKMRSSLIMTIPFRAKGEALDSVE